MEPFNEQEKVCFAEILPGVPELTKYQRHLLAEIIKHSQLDIQYLEALVRHIEPNWMQMQLPNGRNMAQCMKTAESMYIGQRGTKRKASEEEPSTQRNNNTQSPRPQALPLLSQPSPAQNSPAHILRQTSLLSGPHLQQSQQPELPPKKKKGRPAYAGRDVTSQRPFNPRPIAPKPSSQAPQKAHSAYRSIAPAPHIALPPLPPGSLPTVHRGLSLDVSVDLYRAPSNLHPHQSTISLAGELQSSQPAGALDNSPHGEQMSNHPRSLSEGIPRMKKQEDSPNNRPNSLQPVATDDQNHEAESVTPDQVQETKSSPEKEVKNRRHRQG
ncbi:hypothetical protein FBEOM_11970 [Fusarium beomiforme]|uniref:Uncharacterized protein n=1 Tax=Fusarium beomiforme TaxID=44412 RepID=A0A9P5AA16_9HYPO|nr:hypothetical protein FBEOM_11970 [Fusarium beomiforme]